MEGYRCMNHPNEISVAQCTRCGKPLCVSCYDPELGRCQHSCGVVPYGPSGPKQPKSAFWTIVVSLLAILGGLALLLITICGAMIFSY